ncbi:MAG: radical SAM protein [Candidatus Omnitrophica bacterium]|nr:radical SAM protein [Candidatus Omnitrophota bacterium]MBD3268971.1 radical SAM protein [Candidatus Omnitrophota bacterium]
MDCLEKFEKNLAYHYSEVLNYPLAKPYWIYVSLTHRCTYNCQMCGVVKILKGYELDGELLKRTLSEIGSWKWRSAVVFTGGEPFLRKDIFELIEFSSGQGLVTECISNGYPIDQPTAEKIILSGLQNIAVSIDGANALTHDAIREKGSFDRAVRALDYLVRSKKKEGRGPQISIWTTIMKENVEELSQIIYIARDLGVDCLVYHPVIVAQDDMQNTSPQAPFWINSQQIPTLRHQIDTMVDYHKNNGLIPFLHDPYLWIRYFDGSLRREEWKCNPFVFINIGPDGEVRSCGSSFGNLKDMSLGQCLVTNESFEARRKMKNCQKPCLQTCWSHPESDSLEFIVEEFSRELKSKPPSQKVKYINKALSTINCYQKLLKKYV